MPEKETILGMMGCIGGLLIHLVIGSLYQWGIVNIYITSYFQTLDESVTLQKNAIAFPIMMLCIGLTMKVGIFCAEKTHPLIVMTLVVICQSLCVFVSSYIQDMGAFIVVYGVLFGLVSGFNFMVPVIQCNKYFPGKKMYVNGVVLSGTGLGALVFGLFSYNFLNPQKLRPNQGYYRGSESLLEIAQKVPVCLRWLSLLFLLIGLFGVFLISYVCLENKKKQKEAIEITENQKNAQEKRVKKEQNNIEAQAEQRTNQMIVPSTENQFNKQKVGKEMQIRNTSQILQRSKIQQNIIQEPKYPQTIKQVLTTKIFYLLISITFLGSCGTFLINGNYKTYVKQTINDDQFLTIIGVLNSVGNGCSRILWNIFFNHTGYKFVMVVNFVLQIIIFAAIRFTVLNEGGYLFLVFLTGCCMGGYLVMTPTVLQIIMGPKLGSNIYGIFWQVFGLSNLLQFAFVSGLASLITFNGVIYICLGMVSICLFLVVFGNFQAPWKNPMEHMGYHPRINKILDESEEL